MRLPSTAHTEHPWHIHAIAPEFRLEDVWALPTPGGPDDFPDLVHGLAESDPTEHPSAVVRLLFVARLRLGTLLGLDEESSGIGSRVPSLLDRVPPELRGGPLPRFAALPFTPLFLTRDEFAAEAANATMHGVLHLGWVPDESGTGYRGQLAILVKPNGLVGRAYMAGIAPFRHLLVYPQLTRTIGREWRARRTDPPVGTQR